MLINVVWGWLTTALAGIVSLFPSNAVPAALSYSNQTQGSGSVWEWLSWANQYLPLDAVLEAVGVMFTIWAAMWSANLIIWLLSKAHVLGAG